MSPLFVAVAEATEEAIINSLFRAETVRSVVDGHEVVIEAVDTDRIKSILDRARPLEARP